MIDPAVQRAQMRRPVGRPYRLTVMRVLIAAALARQMWMQQGGRVGEPAFGKTGSRARRWAAAMYDYAVAMGDWRLLPDEAFPSWWKRDPLPDVAPTLHPETLCVGGQLASQDWRTPGTNGTWRVRPHPTLDNDEDNPATSNTRHQREGDHA